MAFELTSPAFKEGDLIPKKHTCEGADLSPQLRWAGPPKGLRSFALIADDPDAPVGTWVHWVIFNMPADQHELPEGVPPQEVLPNGARQGLNDFKRVGYGGPCPPPGKPHRYYFKLYAVDVNLDLKPRATKAQVLEAIKGHILGEAQLMGRFGR
jgi:Raf kinase inhibitor-like YbhB/YbcL family protein